MQVCPYLFFEGRCDEALEFYKTALGAEVTFLIRHKDSPEPHRPGSIAPGAEDKVMHSTFRVGQTTLHASDGRCVEKPNFQGFALSLTAATPAEVDRYFTALAEQGQVEVPLGKTFFSPRFGMLTDRFGVRWTVYVSA